VGGTVESECRKKNKVWQGGTYFFATFPQRQYFRLGESSQRFDFYDRLSFGRILGIYDMTQAVEDGATRPVYYESRVIHLKLNESMMREIDAEYDLMAQNAEPYATRKKQNGIERQRGEIKALQRRRLRMRLSGMGLQERKRLR
jgi:hypothetical protein